jgi:hypothetical protein
MAHVASVQVHELSGVFFTPLGYGIPALPDYLHLIHIGHDNSSPALFKKGSGQTQWAVPQDKGYGSHWESGLSTWEPAQAGPSPIPAGEKVRAIKV